LLQIWSQIAKSLSWYKNYSHVCIIIFDHVIIQGNMLYCI
jgi:hypothetical protein